MLQKLMKDLQGDRIIARDGEIGSLHDAYFDDKRWTLRYLVVDTGRWLPGRKILISPASVETSLSSAKKLRLALSRERIENAPPAESDRPKAEQADPHLRSGAEVIGYAIEARDGSIGKVRDFIVDETSWAIRDIVVDTRKWWPGGHVHVHPGYVERIDWNERKLHLRLTREQVKLSGAPSARC
jgi:sporulation protein YlmC with PRC-barrel domain